MTTDPRCESCSLAGACSCGSGIHIIKCADHCRHCSECGRSISYDGGVCQPSCPPPDGIARVFCGECEGYFEIDADDYGGTWYICPSCSE